uniref:Integrin, alpha 6b n=1 Tax=Mastacembelus armatus TaxID=205130 RepID=A0A7N8WTC7_9TELE
RMITCGLWLLGFLLGCGQLSAFNLDTNYVQRKIGDKDSLFGFSLAMHRQLSPADKRMLLVGAPRASSTQGQKSKVTGGLYSCDMSATSERCTRVNFDNGEDLNKESKQNQWLGVTVKSQGPGGKIVTCAHRYQRRANVNTQLESRDIIGRCYVLSQDLTINPGSSEDGGGWHFCDSRPRGHEMFGSCQQGLSATFDKDYHYLIFGAPGTYNWRGVVRLEQKNDTLLEMGIFDDGPFETGDERQKNPELVPAPANSYLGFSLDSGKALTKKGELMVVAGAPRANHSGAVVFLKKGPESSNILLEELILEGEGLASSFGYDLTVLDLNKDGWQDLVVGAPQYFEKDGEIGGAVYVFVNKAGNWAKVTPTRLNGAKDSMFGLAVENLGDINLDGYHDFAVGAPYENGAAGKVYIYLGSAKGLHSEKPSQPLGVRLFGYSLAGNMDLDKNSYPDLAVGSLSDSVTFPPRASPVINIKKEIKFSPKEIDLTKKNCGNNFCLTVEACFTCTASSSSYSSKLILRQRLRVQRNHKHRQQRDKTVCHTSARCTGSDSSLELPRSHLVKVHCGWCLMLQDVAPQENIQDKLRGIPIDVSVAIQGTTRKRRQSSVPQIPPVLDNESTTTRSEVNFLKVGCGSDNVCQSNLQVKYRYGHRSTDEDTFTPLELENGVPVISLSDQKDIALEVTVTNLNGDDAYEAYVKASFPPSLTYSSSHTPPNVRCEANKDGSKTQCNLGNPFKRDSETTFYIIMHTSGISLDTTELEIELQPNTTSDQQNIPPVFAKAKVAIVLQLSISGQAQPSQVYFTGEVIGEAAMKTESEVGSAITHQFRIINLGNRLTDFGTATLKIHWPKLTENGKWLLYLMKISSTGVEKIECSPKNEINRLGLETTNTRIRRAAKNKDESDGIISRLIETKNSKTLSCDNGAQCMTITCPLRGLDSNAVITLYSRLWKGTFIEVKQCSYSAFMPRFEMSRNFMVLCGFFKRAKYEDKVPSYSAVRIKREERVINTGKGDWENLEKKPWMTTWHDSKHYS